MQDTTFDTITNWNNNLTNSYDSRFVKACNQCNDLKTKGFNRSESTEILMASGLGIKGASEVLDTVYGKEDTKLSSNRPVEFVVPTKYADVAPMVEYRLSKDGPEKLIEYLTESENPIIEATDKYKKSILKIAQRAVVDADALNALHEELEPYVEEAMLNSVLLSENDNTRISKVGSNRYKVAILNKEAVVDLETGRSTGARYEGGNFDKIGIADEFLVKAHDALYPYTRLRKALSE